MEWDGKERRADDSRIAVLETEVRNWMETTKDYRKSLCEKIDELKNEVKTVMIRLSELPCSERKSWYKSMEVRVGLTWGAILLTWTIFGVAYAHIVIRR